VYDYYPVKLDQQTLSKTRPIFRGIAPWHCAKGPTPQRGPVLRRWSQQQTTNRSINLTNFHRFRGWIAVTTWAQLKDLNFLGRKVGS